jgi:hypothetical protein
MGSRPPSGDQGASDWLCVIPVQISTALTGPWDGWELPRDGQFRLSRVLERAAATFS